MDTLSDLAIIKLKSTSETQRIRWKVAPICKNSNERLGDWVVAIGSPFGLTNTVTAGIISCKKRKNTEIGGGADDSRVHYIQTDCVVHSGSSGGPLINLNGEVIGITTTRAESEGITFAIRMDNVIEIISQLIKKGKVVRPFLG